VADDFSNAYLSMNLQWFSMVRNEVVATTYLGHGSVGIRTGADPAAMAAQCAECCETF
jgi:hypothetical protein